MTAQFFKRYPVRKIHQITARQITQERQRHADADGDADIRDLVEAPAEAGDQVRRPG